MTPIQCLVDFGLAGFVLGASHALGVTQVVFSIGSSSPSKSAFICINDRESKSSISFFFWGNQRFWRCCHAWGADEEDLTEEDCCWGHVDAVALMSWFVALIAGAGIDDMVEEGLVELEAPAVL